MRLQKEVITFLDILYMYVLICVGFGTLSDIFAELSDSVVEVLTVIVHTGMQYQWRNQKFLWVASRGQNAFLRGQKSKPLLKMTDFDFFSSNGGERGQVGVEPLTVGGGANVPNAPPSWCRHCISSFRLLL